jgi:hypothetical protein
MAGTQVRCANVNVPTCTAENSFEAAASAALGQ